MKIINKIKGMYSDFYHYKNRKSEVIIKDDIFYLDKKDSLDLSNTQAYEPEVTECLKENINEGDVVVDVGANIGVHTLLMAKLVGKKGKVYAFEPNKENFELLCKNIEANEYENIISINKAVSDETGKIKLYLCKDNNATHRTYNSSNISGKFSGKYSEIDCIKLDDFFKDKTKPNLIKIDVEGFEPKAMLGALNLLKNNNIKVITEFYPRLIKEASLDYKEYLRNFFELGYKIYDIEDENKKVKGEEIFEKINPELATYTNLLCLKENERKKFRKEIKKS